MDLLLVVEHPLPVVVVMQQKIRAHLGFRFDPTLQQCVPIIAPNTPTDTTTTPTMPTTPVSRNLTALRGGIANAYPFVLTPPIGAPVGNLPPVRLTT